MKEHNIKEWEIASKEHPTDLIVRQLPKQSIKSSEEQPSDEEIEREEQVVEVSYLDFTFGDRVLILEDCDLLVLVLQLMHLIVR